MSWNFDNYSVPLESSAGYPSNNRRPPTGYADDLNRNRKSFAFLPTQHESVGSYIYRLRNACYELEQTSMNAHVYGKKMWYTHKTPSNCWICELANLANYSIDILLQTISINPEIKNYTFELNPNTKLLEITPPKTS